MARTLLNSLRDGRASPGRARRWTRCSRLRRLRSLRQELVTGGWSHGDDRLPDGSFEPDGGWGLRRLKRDMALDLERRLEGKDKDPEQWYCREP